MSQPVSDQDRKKLEAALAAAILLRYRASHTAARKKLGQPDTTPSKDAKSRISAFASKRSKLVQTGINDRVTAALAALPDDASESDKQQAVAAARQSIEDHHDTTLIPWLALWASNQGQSDGYADTPSESGNGTARDDSFWIWTQRTSFPDSCADAADASPAPYDELVSIAGGEPQWHDGCMCSLDPA